MDYRRVDPRCVMVPCEQPALWMPYLAFHEESSFTSQVRNLVHLRTTFCRSLLICVLQRNLLNYLSRTVISSGSARCHNSKQNTSLNLEIIPHWFLSLGAASLLDRSENILLLHKIRAWCGPWSPYDTFYLLYWVFRVLIPFMGRSILIHLIAYRGNCRYQKHSYLTK